MTKSRIWNAGHKWWLALDKTEVISPAAITRKEAYGVTGAVVLWGFRDRKVYYFWFSP